MLQFRGSVVAGRRAMVRMDDALEQAKLSAQMLLQVQQVDVKVAQNWDEAH